MDPAAVYLHSSWRSSTTYVWAKFRPAGRFCCLLQPLAEHLATATAGTLNRTSQEEFGPLLRPEGGVRDFPARQVYRPWRLDAAAEAPALAAYFAGLGDFARAGGGVPLFGLVRSALRVAWFRRQCRGVHVAVRRDHRRSFLSCLRQSTKGNRYYLERCLVILGNNADDPALAPLQGLVKPAPTGLEGARRDAFFAGQLPAVPTASLYAIHYLLDRLARRQAGACDLVLDVDRIAADPDAARAAETRLGQLTGAEVSFADCRPEGYDDSLGWSAPFFADVEARVDDLPAVQ